MWRCFRALSRRHPPPNRGGRMAYNPRAPPPHRDGRRRRSAEPRGNDRRSVSKDRDKLAERAKRSPRSGGLRDRHNSSKAANADQSSMSNVYSMCWILPSALGHFLGGGGRDSPLASFCPSWTLSLPNYGRSFACFLKRI